MGRRRKRHLYTAIAVLAWSGSGGVIAWSLGWVPPADREVYQHALTVLLSIAITTTLAVLVDTMQTPIQTAYKLGWDAGWADGHRAARPVLVPERRLLERRGHTIRNN